MPTYRRQAVAFVRGEGAALFDADGRRYVDCMAGISMNNVGHCHPAVVAAIAEQSARLINVSNLYYTEPMIALAEWIRDRSLGGRVFFCNSGAEASEAALKLARKRGGPGRPEVVALVDGFHGRTYGALSLTGQPSKQEPFRPLVPGVRHVERDDLEGLAGRRRAADLRDRPRDRPGRDRRAARPRRDAPAGPRAGRPARRAAAGGRDPDRPLAHGAALRLPGRGRDPRRDDARQEPRGRRARSAPSWPGPSTTRCCSRGTTARPSPPGRWPARRRSRRARCWRTPPCRRACAARAPACSPASRASSPTGWRRRPAAAA